MRPKNLYKSYVLARKIEQNMERMMEFDKGKTVRDVGQYAAQLI